MPLADSHLSDANYGYDFVVATSEKSINDGMIKYLQNTRGKQPVIYQCFLANENGIPGAQISLDELLVRSNGINPFEVPSGTPVTDARVETLFKAKFICGIRMQVGIPPGVMKNVPGKGPQADLPAPVVTLGDTADNVTFNMYCSDLTVIKLTPAGGWVVKGSYIHYNQPSGRPWYVSTRTNLMYAPLDKGLNTPYFKNHPEEQALIRAQLNNLSGSAFSLQQLMFNLDSSIPMITPTFKGVQNNEAHYMLSQSFIDLWSRIASERGLPLVAISAVSQPKDDSPMTLTAMDRLVSPVVDQSGEKIKDPTSLEKSAATLNYICAVDGHPLPGAAKFTWNWVDPKDIDQSSGAISIKRDTIAKHIVGQILTKAKRSCIKPWSHVTADDAFGNVTYEWSFHEDQTPTITYPATGPVVAKLDYTKEARSSDTCAATKGELNITSTYSATLTFGSYDNSVSPARWQNDNTFTVEQNLRIHIYTQWAATGSSGDVINTTLKDKYSISVDEHGSLQTALVAGGNSKEEKVKDGDRSCFVNLWTGVNDLIEAIKNRSSDFLGTSIKTIPFDSFKNFIFPGAKVFKYKTANFSKFQDLGCLITYIDPKPDQFPSASMVAMNVEIPQRAEVVHLDEVPGNIPVHTDAVDTAKAASIIATTAEIVNV